MTNYDITLLTASYAHEEIFQCYLVLRREEFRGALHAVCWIVSAKLKISRLLLVRDVHPNRFSIITPAYPQVLTHVLLGKIKSQVGRSINSLQYVTIITDVVFRTSCYVSEKIYIHNRVYTYTNWFTQLYTRLRNQSCNHTNMPYML